MLSVVAKGARDLRDTQRLGRQDPYLILWAGHGGQRVKTRVHQDGGKRAVWGDKFMFNCSDCANDSLYIECKNKNVTDSKTIGMGKVQIATIPSTATDAWYPLFDQKGRPAGHVNMELSMEGGDGSSLATASGPAPPLSGAPNPIQSSPGLGYAQQPPPQQHVQQQFYQPPPQQYHQPPPQQYHQPPPQQYHQPPPQQVYVQQQPPRGPQALPPSWEERQTPDGRRYYVDHDTQTTHWTLPWAT